jgi:4-aminobutyrate aminotransferase
LIERAKELGQRGFERLKTMQASHAVIRDVRSLGCYFGVEIGGADPNTLAERVLYRCLTLGLSFKLGAGNIVTLCPPLTIPLDEFDKAFSVLDNALSECAA